MMLRVYRCDREDCEEETEPLGKGVPPSFVGVIEPCPVHGAHTYHFCSLGCALHGLAQHLDHVEHVEGSREED